MKFKTVGISLCLVTLATLAFLLALSACTRPPAANVIVLHTGRMLGNVYPQSTKRLAPLQYYQFLAGYVRQVRSEAEASGQQVILIDSGDSLRGSFASHATDGDNMVEFFKALHYDALFLGNLDASVSPGVYQRLQPMPVLCPFLDSRTGAPPVGTVTSTRLKKGSLKVDLVANFYGDTSSAEFPDRFPSYYSRDPQTQVQPFRDYAGLFSRRGADHPDLTLLNWFKFEPAAEPPVWITQWAGKEVDAVIAHRIYQSNVKETWGSGEFSSWPIPVSENILRQNRGFTIARMDLKVSSGQPAVLIRQELVQLTANTCGADPEIISIIEKFSPRLQQMDRPVATLEKPIKKDDILLLYLRAVSEAFPCDAVIYSPESVRGEWSAGPLRAGVVYDSLPWDTSLVGLQLTADQFKSLDGLKRLCSLQRTTIAPASSLRIITSPFFAALITRKLGISNESIITLNAPTEFDFLVSYLEKSNSSFKEGTPAGWTFRPSL